MSCLFFIINAEKFFGGFVDINLYIKVDTLEKFYPKRYHFIAYHVNDNTAKRDGCFTSQVHCVKSARIWGFSRPYFPGFGLSITQWCLLLFASNK